MKHFRSCSLRGNLRWEVSILRDRQKLSLLFDKIHDNHNQVSIPIPIKCKNPNCYLQKKKYQSHIQYGVSRILLFPSNNNVNTQEIQLIYKV
jgi:hypothetical protein